MILLDTDVISHLYSPPSATRDRLMLRLKAAADSAEEIAVSILSFEEQVRGWLVQISRASDAAAQVVGYARLNRLLKQYQGSRVLDFDASAADQFKALRVAHRRVGTSDLKIAAVAITHRATLLSRNARDFSVVSGLQFEQFV